MRILAALLALPLLFDVTPAGALKKLVGKENYAFSVETRVDGKIGRDLKVVAENITGVFRKPDVMSAKAGNKLKLARRGSVSLYCEKAEWKTEDAVGEQQAALAQLAELKAPHEEIAKRASGLTPIEAAVDVNGTSCKVFMGEFTKAGAAEMAKDLLNGATERSGLGGAPRGKGGRLAGARTPVQPKDAKGNVKLLIDPVEELPRRLVVEVTFKADYPVDGKMETREITIVRTVTLSNFDKAELDIPGEIRNRLGIADK